jgi:hypothetical protein
MSQRSSGPSGSSSAPVIGNGDITFPQPSERQHSLSSKRPGNLPRSISLSNVFDAKDGRSDNLDPDRLFTTYTISEVKIIQQRLRYVPNPVTVLRDNQGYILERMRMQNRKNSE